MNHHGLHHPLSFNETQDKPVSKHQQFFERKENFEKNLTVYGFYLISDRADNVHLGVFVTHLK